jgi:selenophosphate synthase
MEGVERPADAGIIIAGGHSIDNQNLFFGLAVTGQL